MTLTYNVVVTKDEITPFLTATIKQLPNRTYLTTLRSANRLRDRAKAFLGTSYKHEATGDLRDSIRTEVLDNGKYRVVAGDEKAYYALYAEEGTQGPIVPKIAKVLHFWMDGTEYFRKSVKGQEPKWFFRDSVQIEVDKYMMDIERDFTIMITQ